MSDQPTRIGFVGAGWMGTTLMQRLNEHPHAEVIALHQRSREKALASLKQVGLLESLYFSDYDEMLAMPEVDAVFLCSPNSAHGPQSIAALEAGKHVFCEKPCATTYADFERQVELAKANPDLITYVNYLMNFDTMEQRLLKMVKRGDFGAITQIQVNYRHPINITKDKAWKLSSEIMGDAIGMGIIHALSVMLNLMAAQDAHPIRVYATTCPVKTRPFEPEVIYNIHVQFSNGATGVCLGNVDHANGYDAYHHLHGTEGGFIFDSYLERTHKVRLWSESQTDRQWIRPLDPDACPTDLQWPEDTTTPDSGDVMQHQTGSCVAHFIDCVRTQSPSFLGFEASAPTAELGWAILMSVAKGMPVDVPLDREQARRHFSS
ncbi:MAG: Gfo/Idh/MocA family oxidoreductase [Verrucomicrobiales bacterium]|nr:Gfo/Idh/MocA family oxidoreductase [Verrucomicrobiales bacterium]